MTISGTLTLTSPDALVFFQYEDAILCQWKIFVAHLSLEVILACSVLVRKGSNYFKELTTSVMEAMECIIQYLAEQEAATHSDVFGLLILLPE